MVGPASQVKGPTIDGRRVPLNTRIVLTVKPVLQTCTDHRRHGTSTHTRHTDEREQDTGGGGRLE